MTTIAYKDGILAADTQLTFGGDTFGLCHKIEVLSDGRIVAVAGDIDGEYYFKKYLMGEKVPKDKVSKLKKIEAILIDGNKITWFMNGIEEQPLQDKIFAIGAGHSIARAGMSIGLSAKDAVKLAGETNIYTNKIVDTYDTHKKRLTYGK